MWKDVASKVVENVRVRSGRVEERDFSIVGCI